MEDVWIKVQCRKLPSFIVGCIYRHPKAPKESFTYLEESFRSLCLKKKSIYVFGDLSYDLLLDGSKMLKIIESSNLTLMTKKPTRITENSSTLLDPFFTNSPQTVICTDVFPGLVADHELIVATINIKNLNVNQL